MPLILASKFSAVLSHERIACGVPTISRIVWFGLTLTPSFFKTRTRHLFNTKISLAYFTPARTALCREIILAFIFVLGKSALEMSPFPKSSAKNRKSSFFGLNFNYKAPFLSLKFVKMDMSSFLLKEKSKKSFEDRLNKKADATKKAIKTALTSFDKFCSATYDDRTTDDIFEELNTLKGEEQTDAIYEVIQSWIDWLYSTGKLTTSIRQYFSALKQLFHYKGIKLHPMDVKERVEFKKRIKEELYALELEDIQKIFKFVNPKKSSFYLALISTGARPGELLQVRKSDIDTSKKRIKIRIEAENVKTRTGRSVWLTQETAKFLMIKLRNLEDDDLVWGTNEKSSFSLRNEAKIFNRICELAGFSDRYKSNKFRKITLYSFRSYFFGKAADVHREGYAHRMIGHGGYLPQYDRMSDEKKLEWFLKLEPELVVDSKERDKFTIEKQQKEISELEKKNQELVEYKKKVDQLWMDKLRMEHVQKAMIS